MPDMPEEFTTAWMVWSELNGARSNNGYGPNPISYSEIQAYLSLTGTLLLPYEIKGIRTIDAVFLKSYAEVSRVTKKAAQDSSSTGKPAPKRR